jgi:hypothetical protein
MSVGAAGVEFGPTPSGKTYICLYDHRGANWRKSQWASYVAPTDEFQIFSNADGGNWRDNAGHYWGVLTAEAPPLGTRGEGLAKFPANSVASAPWHGFPVSPRLRGEVDAPPYAFVDDWWRQGVVTRTVARRIQRRKV